MKKAILLLLPIMLGYFALAQQFDFKELHDCAKSRIQNYKNNKAMDIVQNPMLFDYDVSFYHLDIEVSDTTTYVAGSVLINAIVVAETLDTFAFELINAIQIDSVVFNGSNSSFIHETDECFVIPDIVPILNEPFSAKIYYHGMPPPGGFFNGVTTAYDSLFNTHVTWTLSEPFNARQWWPCKQVLEDKADSVWVFLTTDSENKAGSIGLLNDEVLLPNNQVRYEWKSNYPIAYYLISFTVADYMDYSIYAKPAELNGDSILIQNYIYDTINCFNTYKIGMDRTIEMIELFSDLYSLYPFHEEKYGHCLAEISGGMEHQTMTTLHEFGLLLVAHELGHSWFGDNVTCATWSDIWVNEGFATYTDYLAHEKIAGPPWPSIWMNNVHNYILSEPDGSVYVPPEEVQYDNVERIFDSRLSYYKGALMLHMLRFELNDDDLFFQVYKNYQEMFADSIATGLDFLDVLNETTGMDFTYFWDQWYFGEGYPIYTFNWKNQDFLFEIFSSQSTSAPDITAFFKMHIPIKLFLSNGSDTTIRLWQSQPEDYFAHQFSVAVDSIQIDPDLWVLNEVESINSVDDIATNNQVVVSPNPVSSVLHVLTISNEITHVKIVDLAGKTVIELEDKTTHFEVDLSDLTNGVYIISVNLDSYNFTQKILKQ